MKMHDDGEHPEEVKRAIEVLMRYTTENNLGMVQAAGVDEEAKKLGALLIVVSGHGYCKRLMDVMNVFKHAMEMAKGATTTHVFDKPIEGDN
jgi:hypothetical protein